MTTALHLVGAFPYKCWSNNQCHYCCVWDNSCFLKRDNQYGIFPIFSLHNSTISWENPCLAPVSVQSHLQCPILNHPSPHQKSPNALPCAHLWEDVRIYAFKYARTQPAEEIENFLFLSLWSGAMQSSCKKEQGAPRLKENSNTLKRLLYQKIVEP